jgi:hypothetical protein
MRACTTAPSPPALPANAGRCVIPKRRAFTNGARDLARTATAQAVFHAQPACAESKGACCDRLGIFQRVVIPSGVRRGRTQSRDLGFSRHHGGWPASRRDDPKVAQSFSSGNQTTRNRNQVPQGAKERSPLAQAVGGKRKQRNKPRRGERPQPTPQAVGRKRKQRNKLRQGRKNTKLTNNPRARSALKLTVATRRPNLVSLEPHSFRGA